MEACGLKFQRLTKIPCSFPGLLQPVNKKTGQKSKKKKQDIKFQKKSSILRLGEVILNGNYHTKQN